MKSENKNTRLQNLTDLKSLNVSVILSLVDTICVQNKSFENRNMIY
jgi:hypothetical protein